jgi:hypothetical protein
MRTLKKQQKYEASFKHAKEYGCSVAQPLAKQRRLCERKQCLLVSDSTSFCTALVFGTIVFSFVQQCLSFVTVYQYSIRLMEQNNISKYCKIALTASLARAAAISSN